MAQLRKTAEVGTEDEERHCVSSEPDSDGEKQKKKKNDDKTPEEKKLGFVKDWKQV